MCEKKSEGTKAINLVDLEGDFWMICSLSLRKRSDSYGYELIAQLVNGNSIRIAYASPEERNLPEVRDFLVNLIKNGEREIDLREYFKPNPRLVGNYGSTVLPLDSPET